MTMKLFKALLIVQGAYIMITAIWPLVHIESFMAVTGPKHDVWLVKTVSALLLAVGVCLLSFIYNCRETRPAIVLGGFTAVAFISIDFYYALTDVISDVYLIDGIVEVILLALWIVVAMRRPGQSSS